MCLHVFRYGACCPDLKRPTESPVTKGKSNPSGLLCSRHAGSHTSTCLSAIRKMCWFYWFYCTGSARQDYCESKCQMCMHELCVCVHAWVLNICSKTYIFCIISKKYLQYASYCPQTMHSVHRMYTMHSLGAVCCLQTCALYFLHICKVLFWDSCQY